MWEKELEIFQQIIIKKEHLTNFNIEYKVKEKDERFLIIDRFLFKNIKNQDRRCYILGRALNHKEIHAYNNYEKLLNSINIPWLNNAKIWKTKRTIDIITPYVLIETNDGDYELFNFNNKNNNSIKIKNIEFHNNIIDSQQYYIQDTYKETFYEISKNLNKEVILKIKNIYFLKNKNRILDDINTLELKPSFEISSLDLLIIQKQISRNKRQHSGFLFRLIGYQIEINYDEKEKQKFLILNNEKINSKNFFINYIKSKKQSIEDNKEELSSYYDDYDKSEVYKITYDEDDLYSEIWNIKNIILFKIKINEKIPYIDKKKITFNTSKKFISEEDGLKIINNSKLTTTSKLITTKIIYTDNNLKDFFILLDDQELYNKENKKNIQEVKRLIKITFNEQILTSKNNYKDELKNQNIKCEIIEANDMNNDLKNIKCLRARKENDSYDTINSDKINNFIQTVLIDENEIENKIIKNCIKKYQEQFIKNNKQEIDNYLKKTTELLEDEFLRKWKINVKKLEDFEKNKLI